jgi:hypothetical protein
LSRARTASDDQLGHRGATDLRGLVWVRRQPQPITPAYAGFSERLVRVEHLAPTLAPKTPRSSASDSRGDSVGKVSDVVRRSGIDDKVRLARARMDGYA